MTDRRRSLPSVDRLLRSPLVAALGDGAPRDVLVRAVRTALAQARAEPALTPKDDDAWATAIAVLLDTATTPTLRRCVNATGVVVHTNLGRAPLAEDALEAIARTAAGYTTLEYDAARGARGSRHIHCADLLRELTGAEDAIVVNNAASALLLALAAAADGGDVIVSRGELIEIGGGFRIPEIMEESGARLVEVGTTNRTRVGDYEKALGGRAVGRKGGTERVGRTALPPYRPTALLKVHKSNFALTGFTAEASLAELVVLGKKYRAPVLYDLGGGLMTDLSDAGLEGEPTLPGAAQSGATAVVASGDKLLGGPQAGILVGTKKFVGACRSHPLARAARADKLTLAALAATLELYRDPDTVRTAIPVLRMLTADLATLEHRARTLCATFPIGVRAEVVTTRAAVGGGAFPGVELESRGIALAPPTITATALAEKLRKGAIPIVGMIQGGRLILDVRTLLEADDAVVTRAVAEAVRA